MYDCLSTDITPIANGSVANGHVGNKPVLVASSRPTTPPVPCSPETPLANGIPNGHVALLQESPFIGYIIAMHRKMVGACWLYSAEPPPPAGLSSLQMN